MVYDPVFKYGQNFYLVLTEEAKERILNVSDQSNLNTGLHVSSCVFFLCCRPEGLRQMQFMLLTYCFHLLRVTKGARNPHFQVVVVHVSLVCSQDSFGPPLRMHGMHRTQFDNERLDLLSLEI